MENVIPSTDSAPSVAVLNLKIPTMTNFPAAQAAKGTAMSNHNQNQTPDAAMKESAIAINEIQSKALQEEESAKEDVILRRKELKWKLMVASQMRNRAKLEEMRAEANINKRKMIKASTLAAELRNKYIRCAKAAKIASTLYKQMEQDYLKQEEFVANEKMMLTKLSMECQKIGTQLYGPDYKLTNNPDPTRRHLTTHGRILNSGHPSVISPRKRRLPPPPTRLSSLYNTKESPLKNLASYRLTKNFKGIGIPMTDLTYAHNICPNDYICLPDLLGACPDEDCPYQHKSGYMLSDVDKLVDILSYRPSLTGYQADPDLGPKDNEDLCRKKLRDYAAKLIARNTGKSIEIIAKNLVKRVRLERTEHELLTSTRQLPKVSHRISDLVEVSLETTTEK